MRILRNVLAAVATGCLVIAAQAATVTTTADSGPGSLREALAGAPDGDTITFAVPTPATIALASELPITRSVTITGPGANALTILRSVAGSGRLFHLDGTGKQVTLSGMTLTGGSVTGNGGAILNEGGNLTLSFVHIHSNAATGTGGAIFNQFNGAGNQLLIQNSTIAGNSANKSGAIDFIGFKLTIENSTIVDNVVLDSAGAINLFNAEAYVYNSTIARNRATFVGGINSQSSTLTFESSVLDENTDSTLAPNDLNRTGGGTVNATTTLFSEAFVPADNVINGTDSGNITGVAGNVAALANNGGPMPTAALLGTSPGLGTGSNSQGFANDQRGAGYPRNAGGAVDRGAIQAFLPPGVALTPSPLVFGGQVIATTSAPQVVTLQNTGAGPLGIASIAVSGDFAQTSTCGATLAPAATCTISVTFTPTALGVRNGTLTVTSNAASSPDTVPLSGTGIAGPAVSLVPPSLIFGSTVLGTTSAAQVITLQNSGGAPLALAGIVASGDFAQSNDCPGTLAPGLTCAISVTFTPTLVGSRSGAITVTSNGTGSPHSAALSGIGAAAPPPPPPDPAAPIPTLSQWSLIMLGALMAIVALRYRRRLPRH